MTARLAIRWDRTTVLIGGQPVTVVSPVVPDAASPAIKRAIALRRQVNRGGSCSECGARMTLPNRAARRDAARTGRPLSASVRHAADCPAADANLLPLLEEDGR